MYKIFKRCMDFTLALGACIVFAPLMAILAVLIKLDSRGAVIFKQKRLGMDKRHFEILKFRTMRTDAPKDMPTHLLTDPEAHITRMGHFLRRTSLDELPQLVNIIIGDMSIVGPRPALWNQFDLIELRDRYGVNSIRPGLTGFAQVMGRDELPIKVKARYDAIYLRKMSLSFDCKIILKTIRDVVGARGLHH
ncbi:MAG: sugar transferase [Defluviitaleaceae bacterium]|nr:sugar transferase [Defluviitaleaceae bacterium]